MDSVLIVAAPKRLKPKIVAASTIRVGTVIVTLREGPKKYPAGAGGVDFPSFPTFFVSSKLGIKQVGQKIKF